MTTRKVSEAVKKRIAGKQRFKCNNSPDKKIRGLENYKCRLWELADDKDRGIFDESGYDIDYILEHSISANDNEENLQALCKSCHIVKTKKFMMGVQPEPNNTNLIKPIIVEKNKNNQEVNTEVLFNTACRHGYTEIVKLLLEDPRVNPAAKNNDAIRDACYYGHTDIVKLLLEDKRVDSSALNNYAFRWASQNGHTDIVKLLLLDNRVDPSANKSISFHNACGNGHVEIVKLLLADKRIDPNIASKYSFPLWNSCHKKHVEMVKVLLEDNRIDIYDLERSMTLTKNKDQIIYNMLVDYAVKNNIKL